MKAVPLTAACLFAGMGDFFSGLANARIAFCANITESKAKTFLEELKKS